MTHTSKLAFGASAAAAILFTALAAHAQLAPPAPKAQPATPPPAKTTTPPATTPPAAKAVKKAPAPTSACQGLDQNACTAKATDCRWIAAVKRKDGKEVSAYCRSLPKSVKAAPKKVDAAKAPAPATPPAPPAAAAKKAPPPPAATK